MAFISTIPEDTAPTDVKQMYDKNLAAQGYIPNYTKVFSHRPQVIAAWTNLLTSIRGNMDLRRYELVTLLFPMPRFLTLPPQQRLAAFLAKP